MAEESFDKANQADNLELPEWKVEYLQRIQHFNQLDDGWNGYQAPAPDISAINVAAQILKRISVCPARVAPSAVGGVGITFWAANHEVYVEIKNTSNMALVSVTDFNVHETGGEDEGVFKFSTNEDGMQLLISFVESQILCHAQT
ncbi:MAG: hypothetical protein HYV26_12520 [Candidatus Hydrogenedentes bacterium]|nr:hypothetical protein [Candidatus Hydrogenedentota bacterium]